MDTRRQDIKPGDKLLEIEVENWRLAYFYSKDCIPALQELEMHQRFYERTEASPEGSLVCIGRYLYVTREALLDALDRRMKVLVAEDEKKKDPSRCPREGCPGEADTGGECTICDFPIGFKE